MTLILETFYMQSHIIQLYYTHNDIQYIHNI